VTTINYRRTALVQRYAWRLEEDMAYESYPFITESTGETETPDQKLDGEISLIKLTKITTVIAVQEEVLVGDQPIFIRTAIVEREIGGARDSQGGFYGLPHRFTTTETTGSPDEKLHGEVELVSIEKARRKDPQ